MEMTILWLEEHSLILVRLFKSTVTYHKINKIFNLHLLTGIINQLVSKPGPRTIHIPSGEEMDIFDASQLYKKEGNQLIVIAGKEYGTGSSRDWAAKGPWKLGINGKFRSSQFIVLNNILPLYLLTAVIAESFERIHRSNLVGMGIIPLQFLKGQQASSLGLTGKEKYTINIPEDVRPGQIIKVQVISVNKIKHIFRGTILTLIYLRWMDAISKLNYVSILT